MSTGLDAVDITRARDLRGRAWEIWVRRGIACLLAVVPILGLANFLGQRSSNVVASVPAATLVVHSPTKLRGGLLFEARFSIQARADLSKATLVLGDGWANGLTINTVEPQPSEETSHDGKLVFQLGNIAAGNRFVLHMEYQVNPTSVGPRDMTVDLFNGTTHIVGLTRHVTVWP